MKFRYYVIHTVRLKKNVYGTNDAMYAYQSTIASPDVVIDTQSNCVIEYGEEAQIGGLPPEFEAMRRRAIKDVTK